LETFIKLLLDWLTDRYQQGAEKAEEEPRRQKRSREGRRGAEKAEEEPRRQKRKR
jgi:hypothetical protein